MKCTWRREFKRVRALKKTLTQGIDLKVFDNMVSAEIAKSCLVDPTKFHPKYPHKRSKEYVGIKAKYVPKAKYYPSHQLYDRSTASYIINGNIMEALSKGEISHTEIPYFSFQYIDRYYFKRKYNDAETVMCHTNIISENKEENYI